MRLVPSTLLKVDMKVKTLEATNNLGVHIIYSVHT